MFELYGWFLFFFEFPYQIYILHLTGVSMREKSTHQRRQLSRSQHELRIKNGSEFGMFIY